jgi:hypothetical protein
MALSLERWQDLRSAIKEASCTPFVGAGACVFENKEHEPWIPLGTDIAKKWSREYEYPFDDSSVQLAEVSLYMGIMRGNELFAKMQLKDLISRISPPNFLDDEYKNTPHAVLADLDLPTYLTTNYDELLEEALRSRGKKPNSEYCRWNVATQEYGESFLSEKTKYRPTKNEPLVYHLHGRWDVPQSMVLTERDYIDYIIGLTKNPKLLPFVVRQRIAQTSLLLVGYKIKDINFRVIFQAIFGDIRPAYQYPSVSVQLPPMVSEQVREKALQYLNDYTKSMFRIDVYWKDAMKFAAELRKYLESSNGILGND